MNCDAPSRRQTPGVIDSRIRRLTVGPAAIGQPPTVQSTTASNNALP